MSNNIFKRTIILATGIFVAALLVAGLNNYQGSKLVYLLFSVMFWLLLISAFIKRTHYGYLFLTIALWLGFWVKITAHLILKYPYVEPIGHFESSADAWDTVLWVAIMASAGVMLGNLLFALMGNKYSRAIGIDEAKVPVWYPVNRKWIWSFALTLVLGIAAVNMVLGIQQGGLVPRTVLPWPLNALIAVQVSIGNALLITVLLWWEVTLKKSISVSIYAPLVEAIASTVSLLSRGIYIFHTLPLLFSLFENRQWLVGLSRTKVVALILAFLGLMVISISGVTTIRAYMYPHAGGFTTEEQKRLTRLEVLEGGIARVRILIAQGEPQEGHLRELLAEKAQLEKALKAARLEVLDGGIAHANKLIAQGAHQEVHLRELLAEKEQLNNGSMKNGVKSDVVGTSDNVGKAKSAANPDSSRDGLLENKDKLFSELYFQISAGFLPRISALAVDRWIGLEGVMAVSAYPEKSRTLLFDAIKEKREIGKTTKFQEISNSHYRWTDASNWQFASLPGAAAFLYFSGSLWVVLIGMAMFAFLLQLSEQWAFALTSNPLLCSLFGLTLANTIAQFGITPRQDIPFYSMILGFVLLVSVVQSDRVYAVIQKLGPHRGAV